MRLSPLAKALATQEKTSAASEPSPAKSPARPRKRQVSVYLPIPVHERLRLMAFESRRSMHSILMEGLDKILREHGTSVQELIDEDQRQGENPS